MFAGFFTTMFLILAGAVVYALWSGRSGFQKEFRDRDVGFADLVRYGRLVEPGIVLGKGGELISGFFFRGIDLDAAANEQVNVAMARINSMLSKFESGWMVHIDAIRSSAVGYLPDGHFPHKLLRLMDQERREQYMSDGGHYESAYAIIFTWMPPMTIMGKAQSFLYEHSGDRKNLASDLHTKTLDAFKRRMSEVAIDLNRTFQGCVRMRGIVLGEADRVLRNGVQHVADDLVGYLHWCATGQRKTIKVSTVAGNDLDYLIASEDFAGGITPRVGNKHVRPIVIEGFPTECGPLVMERLNRLGAQYRWSTRFIFFDTEEAKNVIGRMRKKWRQKLRPIMEQALGTKGRGPVDQDAARMSLDAEGALGDASMGVVRFGHYTSTVILMDEDIDRVDEHALQIKKLIEDIGFPSRIETVNAVEAFLGTLPGHGYENVRKPLIHTMNLSYLFPASAIWSGVKQHPCQFYPPESPALFMADAAGATPFHGVLHYGDLGHFLLVGPPGSGKSTALQFFAAQHFRYPNANVFLFEKGYSGFALSQASGGSHYDIGGEDYTLTFAPLADIDRPNERMWAEEWITIGLELQGLPIAPRTRTEIREALGRLARLERDQRTMTNFAGQVQNMEIREAIKPYTLAGNNPFLDGVPGTDALEFSRYTVFEMEHLMELGDKHVVPILLYLFHQIERSLKGQPALVILDEAWLMLLHPLFRERIRQWLKTFRKGNIGVGFATQEVGDLANSPIRDVIFSSCVTRILLANPSATTQHQRPLYRELGLNDQEIDLIASATPKRDYYYTSPYGKRLFSLALGPMCVAFAGVSGKDEVRQVRELMKKYEDKWPVEWTRLRAGAGWAARLAA